MNDLYGRYQYAQDATLEVILQYQLDSLPIKVIQLAKDLNVLIFPYDKSLDILNQLGLAKQYKKNDGFSLFFDNQWYIFYNDKITSKGRVKFTIAHEIGHIVLGHHMETKETIHYRIHYTKANNQDDIIVNSIESEANIFASRLLAPKCVLAELNLNDPLKIMDLCGISKRAALIRLEQMKAMQNRHKTTSELETLVLKQFMPFIQSFKGEICYV